MSVSRRELFDIWRQEHDITNKNAAVVTYVLHKFKLMEHKEDTTYQHVKAIIKNINSKFADMWKKCSRSLQVFITRHHEWLDDVVVVIPTENPKGRRKGRPSKEFAEAGDQSKRHKVLPLLETYTTQELSFATSTSLRMSGNRDAALMVQTVTANSPKRATRIKKALSSPKSVATKYTPEEALALYVDGRLTKHSYNLIRAGAKAHNADIYPAYNVIKQAKGACYPDKESLSVSETVAEVKLQSLVDHTAKRLLVVQEDVLKQEACDLSHDLKLIYKWGCDGSSGHSTYKQQFGGEGSALRTDSYLFAVCLVPLRLQSHDDKILWNNPRPSSTRFCRPIKILFEKETSELSKREIENVENQIKDILPTKVCTGDQEISINHCFQLTMIDGKIFGVISQSSTQTCGICGATPKLMNNIEQVMKRVPNTQQYDFGLSTLHAWIRCFETLLHISYRLTVQKWQIRDNNDKTTVDARKTSIRENLKNQMGLLVDIPKPGFGTTNDGNTARRFFQQPALASSITGIDKDLIHRFSVILRTLSCGYAINTDAFHEYARDTAMKFVALYPWYYMPSSIHRILIHGADIIKKAVLPIGLLSEEALESRNKDLRNYRELHTRKMSREKTMEDLFHALLYSSDPIISTLSKSTSTISRKEYVLETDVLKLLADPALEIHTPEMIDSDSDHDADDDFDIYQDSATD